MNQLVQNVDGIPVSHIQFFFADTNQKITLLKLVTIYSL